MAFFLLPATYVFSQEEMQLRDGKEVLQKVSAKLNGLTRMSYRYRQELRYFEDNYHYRKNASIYFEYTPESAAGLRFQAKEEKQDYIYNGEVAMFLKNDMTIDTSVRRTLKQMEDNSYLFNSLPMLRNVLPLAIGKDSISKMVHDTTLDGRSLYCVHMEGPKMYFGTFQGIAYRTAGNTRWIYYLLVDKQNFLPVLFLTKLVRGDDDRDFIAFNYSDIDTGPVKPAGTSWNLATYIAGNYKLLPKAKKKPVIPVGTKVADFSLPLYTKTRIDSLSLSRYAGKIVLLDFWFKSCGPCMAAMPHYNELQAAMGKDFQLLTINIEDPVEDIKFFYDKYQPKYPMLFKGAGIFNSMGLAGCPSSVLLDRSGKVVKVFFGFDKNEIEKQVQLLL
jgi:thiol-disulfide isomerase/thioredoxin